LDGSNRIEEIANQSKVALVFDISYLFFVGIIGAHTRARDNTLQTNTLFPKMVSTYSRAGVNKQAEACPSGPANITPDLASS